MKRILYYLLLLTFVHSVKGQETGLPILHNYSPQEYNNLPQVFSVVQDQNGIMYFGLNEQVMQYDGKTWRTIAVPEKSYIYSLAVDDSNTVFVGATADFGYLKANDKGQFAYQSLSSLMHDKKFKFLSCWQMQIHQNNVYIRTTEGIIQFDKNTKNNIKIYPKSALGERLGALFVSGNKIYVYQEKYKVFEINETGLSAVKASSFFADKEFYATVPNNNTDVLVATRNAGLYRYNPLSDELPQPITVNAPDFFTNNDVYFFNQISNRYYALGSIKKGVLIFDNNGEKVQEINSNTFSGNDYTRNTYTQNNLLWITWNKGITNINSSMDLSFWNQHNGINDIVETIVRFDSVLYVGTQQSLFYLQNNKLQQVTGVPVGQIRHLKDVTIHNTKTLLAATAKGVYEIKKGEAFKIGSSSSTASKILQSKLNPNRIYTTKSSKLISLIYQNNKWIDEGEWKNTKDYFTAIAQDAKGNIWLSAFPNGVFRIEAKDTVSFTCQPKQYTTDNGLPSLKYVVPFEYNDQIIFGTEYGLYQYNETTDMFEKFCELGEQFCNASHQVYSFSQLQNGNIFIAPLENKNSDIGYLNKQKQWIYKPFRRVPAMLLRAFYAEENGVVWMGGSEGLYRYDINRDSTNYDQTYNTIIRKVTIGIDSVIYYGDGSLTASQSSFQKLPSFDNDYNNVNFEYAAPFFDNENKTLYSYQLQGFDKEWSEWKTDGKTNYTNLREGNYTFRVKAKNIYDTESELAQYRFTILPPWYRAWWAYILYIVLVALLIQSIVKINARRLEKDKQRLEAIVTQRTAEVVQQKEEISAIAENLQDANKQISSKNEALESKNIEIEQKNVELEHQHNQITASIRYARKIQQAILPIAENLNTYFDTFVLYRPKDIVSGDFYWFSHIEANGTEYWFVAVVDCTGHGVPGAFMSMIGNRLLNEIVTEKKIYEPNLILENLDVMVVKALQQQQSENNDGMDVSLLRVEKQGDVFSICFAGAKNSMYYHQKQQNQIIEIDATRRSIGGYKIRTANTPFVCECLNINKGDTIYLYSDGLVDQNNAQRKRFGSNTFKRNLLEYAHLPMQQQLQQLEAVLDKWQENTEQRDDITVLGLRMI